MRPVDFKDEFYDRDPLSSNNDLYGVVGRSEQLPCGDLIKHNFSLSKIGRCITCDRSKDKAR